MPVVMGAKAPSFRDPLGLLSDCHRRIEKFLGILARVGKEAGHGNLNDEERSALETSLRYFREAAPRHTADEEESLFPRLRKLDRPELRNTLDRMEVMEKEHKSAEKRHHEVDRLGQAWLDQGTIEAGDRTRFLELLAELKELYDIHISIEDHEIFPAAAAALDQAQRDQVGAEMAARRGKQMI